MAIDHGGKSRGCWNPKGLSVVAMLCIASLGCGGQNPVGGRVTRTDGTPLANARIVFRAIKTGVTCTGVTNDTGDYELRRQQPGDGVPAGDYQVLIAETLGADPHDPEAPGPPTIDWKYRRLETSGLKYTVKPGRNTFDIIVEPAQTKRHVSGKKTYPVGKS